MTRSTHRLLAISALCLSFASPQVLRAQGLEPASAVDLPARVRKLIADFESKAPGALALGIVKYSLRGQPLWLIPSGCCDRFNHLYTLEGVALCAPSGGIAGQGDGRCPADIEPVARPGQGMPP